MNTSATNRPTIIPTLRYKDARAAIDWLTLAFGFTEHLVVPGENGNIVHAQLTFGNGMIMLGSSSDDAFDQLQQAPSGSKGPVFQSPYIIVTDIDTHYQRALAAGASIAVDLRAEDYGGKVYSCWDPQGQLWNFGSYDPWADASL